jgi:hypothetical protein
MVMRGVPEPAEPADVQEPIEVIKVKFPPLDGQKTEHRSVSSLLKDPQYSGWLQERVPQLDGDGRPIGPGSLECLVESDHPRTINIFRKDAGSRRTETAPGSGRYFSDWRFVNTFRGSRWQPDNGRTQYRRQFLTKALEDEAEWQVSKSAKVQLDGEAKIRVAELVIIEGGLPFRLASLPLWRLLTDGHDWSERKAARSILATGERVEEVHIREASELYNTSVHFDGSTLHERPLVVVQMGGLDVRNRRVKTALMGVRQLASSYDSVTLSDVVMAEQFRFNISTPVTTTDGAALESRVGKVILPSVARDIIAIAKGKLDLVGAMSGEAGDEGMPEDGRWTIADYDRKVRWALGNIYVPPSMKGHLEAVRVTRAERVAWGRDRKRFSLFRRSFWIVRYDSEHDRL